MPRKQKRTITGEAAQPLGAVPGQMYGMGVEQQRMQEALPAPQVRQLDQPTPAGVPPAAAEPGAPAAAPAAAPTREEQYAQAMAAAQQMRGAAGILTRPTDMPNVPVTNGISSGPGAGPEILGRRNGTPTGRRLRELTQLTGDPIFQQLAERARL